jgi:hypothetical protein
MHSLHVALSLLAVASLFTAALPVAALHHPWRHRTHILQSQPRHLSPYHNAWQCAASSIREEGRGVLAKGLGATMGRGFIVNAAIFASFEALSNAMAAA